MGGRSDLSVGRLLRFRRTGLIRTATHRWFFGLTILFTSFAIMDPILLVAPFAKPFISVILSVIVLALGVGGIAGTAGSVVGPRLRVGRE